MEWLLGLYHSDVYQENGRYCTPSDFDKCINNCTLRCPENNVIHGCNQMFSCPQACKIRYFGLDSDACKYEYISMHNQMKTTVINFFPSIKFERNAKSGCMSTVSGFVFKLCRQCNQERADPELTTFVKNGQLMTSARLDAATTMVRINHWFYFQSHLRY